MPATADRDLGSRQRGGRKWVRGAGHKSGKGARCGVFRGCEDAVDPSVA